jgi:hypothetical protein
MRICQLALAGKRGLPLADIGQICLIEFPATVVENKSPFPLLGPIACALQPVLGDQSALQVQLAADTQ